MASLGGRARPSRAVRLPPVFFVVYEPPRPQRTTSKATTEICSHDGGACWYVFNLRSQTGLALNHRAVTLRLDLQHYKFHVKCWWTAQEISERVQDAKSTPMDSVQKQAALHAEVDWSPA